MTIRSIAALSAVLLGLAVVPAAALDISIGASANGSAGAGNGGASNSVGASFGASASASSGGGGVSGSLVGSGTASGSLSASLTNEDLLVDVVALINASAFDDASFDGIEAVARTTYDLTAVVNSQNAATLEAALDANASEIADLHAALSANADFSGWLSAQGTNVDSVIAIGVTGEGSLAIFTYQ